MTAGDKLVAWRMKRGLTQRQAAELVGVEQPTWHGYENGKAPRAPTLQRIIQATDGAVTAEDYAETDEARAIRQARRAARTAPKKDESGTSLDAAAKRAG
jgi:transcriptional regulator with XRE-family HTH domain